MLLTYKLKKFLYKDNIVFVCSYFKDKVVLRLELDFKNSEVYRIKDKCNLKYVLEIFNLLEGCITKHLEETKIEKVNVKYLEKKIKEEILKE